MAKRVSARRIKKNRLYTYDEAAEAVGVTPQTVRKWRSEGLPVLNENVPHLIVGEAFKIFVERRNHKIRCPLQIDEIYCLSCKAPSKPFGMMADFVPKSETTGILETICEKCERPCKRFIRTSDLPRFSEVFEIAPRPPLSTPSETNSRPNKTMGAMEKRSANKPASND